MAFEFRPTVPIWFCKHSLTFVAGEGQVPSWSFMQARPIYGEWVEGFGDRAVMASAAGVNNFATVRTFYLPDIYTEMSTERVIVVKNSTNGTLISGVPQIDHPNVYELWGIPNNYKGENRFIEFRVKRVERL